ncbi:MAG: ABC transporter permease subunit [Firmicutes bacterium]|nr:ABC transporter permease subunit [Bacillota bacterium]
MGVFTLVTVREILRKKLFLITVLITALYLALYGVTLQYAQSSVATSDNVMLKAILIPQVLTAGLYFASLLVAVFAIFITVSTISGEIETGIMHTVAAGPVSRTKILLGKFSGLALVVSIYAVLLFAGVTLLVATITGHTAGSYWSAMATFSFLPVFLVGLTIAGSAILPTTANGIVVLTLYALSLVGGVVEQIATITDNTTLVKMGVISSLLMPADSIYRKMTSLVIDVENNPLAGLIMIGPFGVQTTPSIWMMVYTGAYLVAVLALAIAFFRLRDI